MRSVDYGDNYQAHLLEQYKLYVEMADRISQRRDHANRFYASAVSAIVALLVVTAKVRLAWEQLGCRITSSWYFLARRCQRFGTSTSDRIRY